VRAIFLHGLSTRREMSTESSCKRIHTKLTIAELCKKIARTLVSKGARQMWYA
jgi:hypothetical protein